MAVRVLSVFLLVSSALGDYIHQEFYSSSDGCSGAILETSASFSGCKLTATAGSMQLSCTSESSASMLSYSSNDCSGANTATPFPWPFGCDSDKSLSSTCKQGNFTAPPNSTLELHYDAPDGCPATGDILLALSRPIGVCEAPPPGLNGLVYGCNAENMTATIFATTDCSGVGTIVPIAAVCAVSSSEG